MRVPKPYNDVTPMPFGQYKGRPLRDVPAWYLLKLRGSGTLVDFFLRDYIDEHMEELQQRKTQPVSRQQAERLVDNKGQIRRLRYKPMQTRPGDDV